jgi:hypothetical protein
MPRTDCQLTCALKPWQPLSAPNSGYTLEQIVLATMRPEHYFRDGLPHDLRESESEETEDTADTGASPMRSFSGYRSIGNEDGPSPAPRKRGGLCQGHAASRRGRVSQ